MQRDESGQNSGDRHEHRDGDAVGASERVGVRFGFAGKGLAGSPGRYGIVPIEPWLAIKVKYFGRHKGGAIRGGVLVALIDPPQPLPIPVRWSCDTDAVIAAMDATGANEVA